MPFIQGNSRVLFLVVTGLVIVGAVLYILYGTSQDTAVKPTATSTSSEQTPDATDDVSVTWRTYTNETFGFSIEYPSNWRFAEFPDDAIAPTFNFYPAGTDTSKLPFTHHSESVTHVSVFPQGIPTEGFFGETAETEVDFQVSTNNARNFVLADGTPFATMAVVSNGAAGWTDWAFLFAHVVVDEMAVTCMRGGAEVTDDLCDPLAGDTLVRSGKIDAAHRAIEKRMLESFRFTE